LKTRRRIDVPVRCPRGGSGPLWRGLAESLAWQIDIGRLSPGSRLPATRTLARDLAISRTTVVVAYDELASRGYLRARVGDGAYVGKPAERRTPALRDRVCLTGGAPDGTTLVLIR
jgi:GntR family transcriptional regulator/MocR family aminotransferase